MRWPHFLWDTVQFPTDFHIKITRLLHFWEDGIKTELCATLQVCAYETILKTIIFSWGFFIWCLHCRLYYKFYISVYFFKNPIACLQKYVTYFFRLSMLYWWCGIYLCSAHEIINHNLFYSIWEQFRGTFSSQALTSKSRSISPLLIFVTLSEC